VNEVQRCPQTGRAFEVGYGALPKDQQTANFVRERDTAADKPKQGERCPITGRLYECGWGSLTKTAQTALFVRDAHPPTPEEKQHIKAMDIANEAERLAREEQAALAAMISHGSSIN
jgi:hypothetical protein